MKIDKNKRFMLSAKDDGLYLTVFGSEGEDDGIGFNLFLRYIDIKKIEKCDLSIARSAFYAGIEEKTVKISDKTGLFAFDEFGEYKTDDTSMSVKAVFYPPFEGASLLSEQEIIKDLQHMGVVYGVNSDSIRQFLQERDYGKEYLVASGRPAIDGVDAKVILNFNTDLKPKPQLKEDGTVDFHSLDNVNHVKIGDVLAYMIPEKPGEPGINIFGKAIQPRRAKREHFRYQKNAKVSEDGRTLLSEVDGHVILENDKIVVSNVMELINVDNSTGDIEYNGNLNIKGNVLAGFTVKASGDIYINGMIEGARIIAGGNITIRNGVQGMNRAVMEAKGNIVTRFIESAESITAGGSIETDYILHSKVSAKGNILVKGNKGVIIGGIVKSICCVEAKSIGSEMGIMTVIGVGIDPSVKKRIDELKKELDKSGNQKIQLNQILAALRKKQEMQSGYLDPDKQEMMQKTLRNLIRIEQQINIDAKELEDCRKQLVENNQARIKVNNVIYPETKIMFGEQFIFIKKKNNYCQFMKTDGEIKSSPLA